MRLLTLLICVLGLFCSSLQAQAAKSLSTVGLKAAEESNWSNRTNISKSVTENILSRIDDRVVQEMEQAWRGVGAGVDSQEAVILLFRMPDGSIQARPQSATNEHKSFTVKWHPSAIAILHTHPISVNPRPSRVDQEVADKLGVPIFTITTRGMYVYDPKSKNTWMVQPRLDWLNPSKWKPS